MPLRLHPQFISKDLCSEYREHARIHFHFYCERLGRFSGLDRLVHGVGEGTVGTLILGPIP